MTAAVQLSVAVVTLILPQMNSQLCTNLRGRRYLDFQASCGDDGVAVPPIGQPVEQWQSCNVTTKAYTLAEAQPTGFPQYFTNLRNDSELPVSASDTLLSLQAVASDCSEIKTIARSYNGLPWEGLFPNPQQLHCNGTSCVILLDGSLSDNIGGFRIDAIQQERRPTEAESIARLLMQGTFGPTRKQIKNTLSASGRLENAAASPDTTVAEAWINAQLALEPTLLRSRFRKRANPRLFHEAYEGASIGPCMDGARYNRYAFDNMDRGRVITVRGDPALGRFVIETAVGIVRTESLDVGGAPYPGACRCRDDHGCRHRSSASRDWCRVENGLFCGDTEDWTYDFEQNNKDVWSYNACNLPRNISGLGYILVQENVECRTDVGEVDLEDQSSLEACAQRCRDYPGCLYFRYSNDGDDECRMENVTTDDCGERGYEVDPYNLYKLNDTETAVLELASEEERREGVYDLNETLQFRICSVREQKGGFISVVPLRANVDCHNTDRIYLKNPLLSFSTPPSFAQIYSYEAVTFESVWNQHAIILSGQADICMGSKHGGRIHIGIDHGNNNITYYQYDNRLRLVRNIPNAPSSVDSATSSKGRLGFCPSVPRTLLNEDSCVRHEGSICSEPRFSSSTFELNASTLRLWYDESNKYVFVMRGFRLEEGSVFRYPPCSRASTSRWVRVAESGGCASVSSTGQTHYISWGFNSPDKYITVQTGDTVVWQWNLDTDHHNVVSGRRPDRDGLFESSFMNSGSFSYVFNTVGNYSFYCSPHPGMDGVISVQAAPVNSIANIISGQTATTISNAIRNNAGGNSSPFIRDVEVDDYINYSEGELHHILLRAGVECERDDGEKYLGLAQTPEDCASKCREERNCKYFIFGIDSKSGRCYSEDVNEDDCGSEGFEIDHYDFYKINDTVDQSKCILDNSTIGAYVSVDDTCWKHSHPNEASVYDLSSWVYHHPGNEELWDRHLPNPFLKHGEDGYHEFLYPSWHPMSRWETYVGSSDIVYIGESGGMIDFANLPTQLQTMELASRVDSTVQYPDIGFEACGSPGEVANDGLLANRYWTRDDDQGDQGLDQRKQARHGDGPGRHIAWTSTMLQADDQLRHRVAWALSQIIVVGQNDLDIDEMSEPWLVFYDIFVANAFGNYRDILQQISASPLMGRYLTLQGNEAFAYRGTFPDENFAREIMQLFTIGLYELNMNGTYKTDSTGARVGTYTNEDILSGSRIWTGWFGQARRANIEQQGSTNNIDPMTLRAERRDFFPKSLLGGPQVGHIGDSYPLCSQLPPLHFLRRGAKYRFHGSQSIYSAAHDNVMNSSNVREHMTPDPENSLLYSALCQKVTVASGEKCSFPPVVTLESDLRCFGDAECNADMLWAVKIVDGDVEGYYTYVQPPCVRLQFFDGKRAQIHWDRICADPSVPSTIGVRCCHDAQSNEGSVCPASHPFYDGNFGSTRFGDLCVASKQHWGEWACPPGCQRVDGYPFCALPSNTSSPCHLQLDGIASAGTEECLFVVESMRYRTAVARCATVHDRGTLCPSYTDRGDPTPDGRSPDWQETCGGFQYVWTNEPCSLRVQVFPSGEISVVDQGSRMSYLMKDSGSKFTVAWASNPVGQALPYPHHAGGCAEGCRVLTEAGGSCLCDATVEETPFVTENRTRIPSERNLRAALKIGAFPPSMYGLEYTLCRTTLCLSRPGINVYTRNGGTFDTDTIFEFTRTNYTKTPSIRKKARYLLNRVSTVHVGKVKAFTMLSPYPVRAVSCTASSTRTHANGDYDCTEAIDEGTSRYQQWRSTKNAGIGAWLHINLAQSAELYMIAIVSTRHKEARAKDILLSYSDGSSEQLSLRNSDHLESYLLRSRINTTSVNISVLDIHVRPCIFPFIYENITYNNCTFVDKDYPWCAVALDENGIESDWGHCAEDGVNTIVGQKHNNHWVGIAEVLFHSAGTVSRASLTPCEDAGLEAANQLDCETAHIFLAERDGKAVREGRDGLNQVTYDDDKPYGCSIDVGDKNANGQFDGNYHTHWNYRKLTHFWDLDSWPVCMIPSHASTNTGFTFRNPVHFMPNAGESLFSIPGDDRYHPFGEDDDHLEAVAEYETHALLDHLFEHPNTPPFVAYRMIQRLVTSNPSPRYIESVATAFRDGQYNGRVYSGKYGDLAAMTSAILLDSEARSSILDLDPHHGQLREPILKLLHMMRSMEFSPADNMETDIENMQRRIGQMAFEQPSVFNFFLPEFAPAGPVEDAGLAAPESQIATRPFIIGYLNGMSSLIDFGLTSCESGFGGWFSGQSCNRNGIHEDAVGNFTFIPTDPSQPQRVVDELARLLTAGRLSQNTKEILLKSYTDYIAETTFHYHSNLNDTWYSHLSLSEDECHVAVKRALNVAPVEIIYCNHSSRLRSSTGCEKSYDDDSQSSWRPDNDPNEIGEWVLFNFFRMTTIDKFVVVQRRDNRERPFKTFSLHFSDDTSHIVHLHNSYAGKTYRFAPKQTSYVRVEILERHETSCLFPFEYQGITYNECTGNGDRGPELWCLTEDDEKMWGYCNPVTNNQTIIGHDSMGITNIRFYPPTSASDPFSIQPRISMVRGSWASVPPGCSYDLRDNDAFWNRNSIGCGSPDCNRYTSVVASKSNLMWVNEFSTSRWRSSEHKWNGIDGDHSTCVFTGSGNNSWWELDLGSVQNITSLILYDIQYSDGNYRGNSFNIYIDDILCKRQYACKSMGCPRVACPQDGRIIRIERPTSMSIGSVRFCELEVYVYQHGNLNGNFPRNAVAESNALRRALKIAMMAPEFHVTNVPTLPPIGEIEREPYEPSQSQNRPYKAVVVIFLHGGADSYNILVPHSGCAEHDLYEEYARVRGNDPETHFALRKDELLQIDANASEQPCSKFGLHPSLTYLQSLYDAGDAIALANLGPLVEPVNLNQYENRRNSNEIKFPPGLFSHNSMRRDVRTVHSGKIDAKGVLGRMVNELNAQEQQPYKSAMYSMQGYARMLDGGLITPETIDAGDHGVSRFNDYSTFENEIHNLTRLKSQSIFAEVFSSTLQHSINSSEKLGADLERIALHSGRVFTTEGESLAEQLQEVAKVMQLETSEYNMERAAFYTSIGGFDTHGTHDISSHMMRINNALASFSDEMRDQGLWDNITVVIASDFGRTLSSNGQGSDHGWGGNYFMFGGNIKGKNILGTYPSRLVEYESDVNIGRGRYIPTTPWEAVWNAVAEWWDLDTSARRRILPNLQNFPESAIFRKAQVYKN